MKYLLCDAHDSVLAFANVTMICDSTFLRTYATVHMLGLYRIFTSAPNKMV